MAKASPQRLQVVASFETKEPQCGQRSGIFSLSFAGSMPGCGRTLAVNGLWLCSWFPLKFSEGTKIAKGERRDKWKRSFQFGYAEPHPIFDWEKIAASQPDIPNPMSVSRMSLTRLMKGQADRSWF